MSTLKNAARQKSVIFTGFFDAVMFRELHSHQLMSPWEKALKRKYPELETIDLCGIRKQAVQETGTEECAIPYSSLTELIYGKIASLTDVSFTSEEFEAVSYTIDYSLDMATQYPNRRLIDLLWKLKEEGKRIYLVSDYYLPEKCYEHFLQPFGLNGLFDGIFCSSDLRKTIISGDLYPEVLAQLNISPADCFMIGGQKKADVEMALKAGIAAMQYFPLHQKIKTYFRKYTGKDYTKKICKCFFRNCFRNTLFGEYSLNLFYFTDKIYRSFLASGCRTAYFLARGGYFLENCFDAYNALMPKTQSIGSVYLKNSRKVNRLASENEADRALLKDYLTEQIGAPEACFVDEGWYCTSQILMEKLYGLKIRGYYLGIMGRNPEDSQYSRKGILFDIDEKGNASPLYGVFRTNCTFYEQLLSAPHGSTVRYCRQNGKTEAVEEWQEIERKTYYEHIEPLQKMIADYCIGLQAWNAELSLYELSTYVLKTLMFGSEERLRLLKAVNDGWYDNANDTKEKKFGKLNSMKISLSELLFRPENCLRYFCKLKELKLTHPVMRLIYPVLGPMIYLYCRLSILKYKGTKEL